jgi:hypothetical protein
MSEKLNELRELRENACFYWEDAVRHANAVRSGPWLPSELKAAEDMCVERYEQLKQLDFLIAEERAKR